MPAFSFDVLHHPALWRGNDCAQVAISSVPTGFAELDVLLPGRGWPREALTEIYVERPGIGELHLLMPALARLTQDERWLAIVAPPYIPYAPALRAHGVRLSHVMLIRPETVELQLWAGEQALRSGSCGAVLLWLNHVPERALRRLQLAAEGSRALVMLFRLARTAPFTSAALRFHVSKAEGRTIVRILKRRGGGVPAPVVLDLHSITAGRFAASCPPVFVETSPFQAAH
jgi:cell division inhibitor SulA/protein ImuA